MRKYRELTSIFNGKNSQVYRARQLKDGRSVILKMLSADYPTPEQLRRYKQEYELTHRLNLQNVIKSYRFEQWQRKLVIVFEDVDGISFQEYLTKFPQGLPLELFFPLALQIVNGLSELHDQKIIHKDINPANIILNPKTRELKLIDLGISSQLSQEHPLLESPQTLEGTLHYISPEQTGRMNRTLDYRTDFYSLGVTFYELLTGKLPFMTDVPMKLIHSHLAKEPVSLSIIKNNDIPAIVAEIVAKLMAKNAEDRYQSAWGLKSDLEKCLMTWQQTRNIPRFTLGQNDYIDQLQIPQKLYGREQEISALLAAFERVSTENKKLETKNSFNSELILVTGYSGIGKSALVRSLYKPVTEKRGYFISGKFDQFQRNIPYSGIVNAFAGLIKQLLGESDVVLNQWRDKLLKTLGNNGQVVVDVIPDLELIIGTQPQVPELGAIEAQNRFNLVFQSFVQACCDSTHPLVLFLDDLQWADLATLKLLEQLLAKSKIKYLLIILAYRNNEVSSTHPLSLTIKKLLQKGISPEQITLTPLSSSQVAELIADTIHEEIATVGDLAQLVVNKTRGNPFFTKQFLKTLDQEKLLIFDHGLRKWQWELEKIEQMAFTDNVVKLMARRLQKLPTSLQNILSTAAYLGTEFDLKTLCLIENQTSSAIFSELKLAME